MHGIFGGGIRAWARDGIAAFAVLLLGIAYCPAWADPVADFYRGKTIKLYISSTPGAGYDIYARLLARFMGEHIPGRPAILPQNMPGAEGRIAAAYIYNVTAKDGLSLGALNRSVALAQAMGTVQLKFDSARFNWIGNPASDNSTLTTWYMSGVKTIEDAKRKEVTIGATGDGNSYIYPKVLNAVVGTKFKIIRGYPGGAEVNLAMEKGEVGGRGDNAWGSWKSSRPAWLAEHKISILVQIGLHRAPDLPDVPLLIELAHNPEDQALFKFLSEPAALGHPVVTSPDVPTERVNALRAAFDATIADPAFLAEAKRQKREINPLSGAEEERIVRDILATPKSVRDRLSAIILGQDRK
jgi:tripartite-type tricarboxylate transporter receptor subunit TctC